VILVEIKVNGLNLYYDQQGFGKPLVLSHGWLDDSSIWHRQVELFSKGHTVISYDLRGHGRSDKPRNDYSLTTLADDLYALIKKLKLQEVTLIGFSLGGEAALVCALMYPEQISKLVLVGVTAKFPPSMYFPYILFHLLPYNTFKKFISKQKCYEPSQQLINESIARTMAVPKYSASECMEQFTRHYDVRNRLSQIKIPTLIITGDKDRINLKASYLMNKMIKNSELQVFPSCGHTVMLEKPEQFNESVLKFISE
jgi:3-oxoadipate enol-lactonase